MYQDQPREILNEPDKGMGRATGVLARLFRLILVENRIDIPRWSRLMDRYLDDPRNGIPRNGKDRSSARGNLNKELRRETMTWKVFRKALQFLGPVSIRFEVHLTWANKVTSIHHLDMPLHPTSTVDEEED